MLSTLIAWGIPRDYADSNPCRDIGDLANADGYPPWEWEDVLYARVNLPRHLWHVSAVALFTGQRQSDVLSMDWNRIAGNEISVVQEKTGKRLWLPIHAELRPVLDEIPHISTRILTNSRGLPWASGFKAAWQLAMNRPDFADFRKRRLVFHGLRKSAVCMLLESGCTDGEVAAITGQSREMIQHYSLMVNQRRLARSAILRWESSKRG
jgi:integrase